MSNLDRFFANVRQGISYSLPPYFTPITHTHTLACAHASTHMHARLSEVFGHHVPPEQLQCALASSLCNSTGGMNTIHPKDIPSFGVLMMVVKSAV